MIYPKRISIDTIYEEDSEAIKGKPFEYWEDPKTNITCPCCKKNRKRGYFPYINRGSIALTDLSVKKGEASGRYRSILCQYCINALYDRFVKEQGGDPFKALYHMCMFLNLYYNDKLAHDIYNDKDRKYVDGTTLNKKIAFVDLYIRYIVEDAEFGDKDFFSSENFILAYEYTINKDFDLDSFEQIKIERAKISALQAQIDEERASLDKQKKEFENFKASEPKNMTEEEIVNSLSNQDKENRLQIIQVFHSDPFEKDEIEDRVKLYNDLVTMIDDAMHEDLVRQKSAVEICRSFQRIEKLSDAIRQLQSTPESIIENEKTLKSLIEQKQKETSLVTSFSKDHGFASKYAISKSKGSGTLSAIIRDMKDAHYDRGITNRYDIETSEAIKTVSDISAESIFKQLQLTDSEYANMVKQQAEALKTLREKNHRLEEELRLYKERHLKEELMEELEKDLRKKGLAEKDIKNVLDAEINKN